MRDHLPILIELVLVFGGVLLFAWWQLREIEVDRRKAAQAREEARARAAAPDAAAREAPSDARAETSRPDD